MPRSVVGVLAAVGAAMSAVATSAHGCIFWAATADAAVDAGLVACLTLVRPASRDQKKANA
jgi:hypothetical protein